METSREKQTGTGAENSESRKSVKVIKISMNTRLFTVSLFISSCYFRVSLVTVCLGSAGQKVISDKSEHGIVSPNKLSSLRMTPEGQSASNVFVCHQLKPDIVPFNE